MRLRSNRYFAYTSAGSVNDCEGKDHTAGIRFLFVKIEKKITTIDRSLSEDLTCNLLHRARIGVCEMSILVKS